MKRRFQPFILLSALAGSLCPVEAGVPARQADLTLLLPGQAELGTWQPDGEPQVFKGEDLFVYIDGGADIYFEYGFVQVLVQDYRNPAGHGMSLEIFEMTPAESAFGIYTFKTSPGGKEIDLGDECRLADYYLNLRKGILVVTITGLEQETATEEGLLFLARAVGTRIKGGAARPALAGRLPEEGLKPQSLKFFKGPLGLANSDRLLAGSVLGFERGIKGDYDPGYSLILLEFLDEPSGAARFAAGLKFFSQSQKFRKFAPQSRRFEAEDEKGRRVSGVLRGRFLVLVTGADTPEQVKEAMGRLADRLPDSS